MNDSSQNDFASELSELVRRLKEQTGKDLSEMSCGVEYTSGGIGCDLVLPYSSLPALQGERWMRD